MLFLKPNTAVIGPGEPVVYPAFSENVHHEAELAVVIGRVCKDVPAERVPEVVFGYTCSNDVTARDVQKTDGQWARAKGFDSSCPLGPWIETELDPSDLAISPRRQRRDPPGRPHQPDGPRRGRARPVRQQRIHAPAGRRDPHRHAGRRRPDRARRHGVGEIEGIGTLTNRVVARG